MSELKTEKRIPPSLKGTIYQIFIEAISEEIKDFRDQMKSIKTSFFDVYSMEKERLIQISESFGVPFSTVVKDDLDFMRQEVINIGFKLFYKGTPTLYKSFFPSIDRIGQMFIYTYSSASEILLRSMKDPCDNAKITAPNLPFLFESKNDFSGIIKDYLTLDSAMILDDSPPFKLDTSDSKISSNHIGLEYFIDRLIEKNSKKYLMTTEYLLYLSENMEWGRRCKEVPHIGSQLSVQTDLSGKINSKFPQQLYSVPSLELNVVAAPNLLDLVASQYDIVECRFGIGVQELPSVQKPDVPFPNDLRTPIAKTEVYSSYTYSNDTYIGASCEYIGQEIKQIKIKDTFLEDETHFEFTLPLAPIRKGNVKISIYTPKELIPIEVIDDQKGNFLSTKLKGTIDYSTGKCILDSKFEYSSSTLIENAYSIEDETLWNFVIPKGEKDTITPGSIKLSFFVGEGDKKTSYTTEDNGEGKFKANSVIVSSSIDYSTGEVEIRFTKPLTKDTPISVRFSYPVNWIPSTDSSMYASYFFVVNTIEITEFGFFNKNGDLLMYATFPPLEFSSTDFHSNFTILVDKKFKSS